ncbi:hypothetical protein IFM89_014689 [Coptis chinensis]|uniref:BZIP domain-containing protein n=1 Tax=Coptis chinensis TaxID=261450 RepID=A0A835HAX3_9MAGN|nr:hypothetical protein IFM89_014689 [Coptis chinensis]
MAADETDNKEEEIRVLFSASVSSCSSSSCSVSNNNNKVKKEVVVVVDEMVENELDAARALADFAQLALLESENSSTSINWGNKRRRSLKRCVQNEPVPDGKNFKSCSSDLVVVQEAPVEDNQSHKKVRKNVMTRTVKAEPDLELPRSTPQCSTSCVSSGGGGGGRPRHQLTEAEKEAKRIRRILANRESARQTIRRRQAMCDELTKKAADLALYNESMKREKELIMKEYQLLMDKNKLLKEQIARTIKAEKEEVPLNTVKGVSSLSGKQQPLHVYNRPTITPFVWSPMIQSLDPVHTQPLPDDPTVSTCKRESSDEQGNSLGTTGPRSPFYIMPGQWFFPIGNGLYPPPLESFCLLNKQEDVSLVDPCDQGASLTDTQNNENHQLPSYREVIRDDFSPKENKSPDNRPDTSIRLATSEENPLGASNHVLVSHRCVDPAMPNKCENTFQHDSASKEESGSPTGSHTGTVFPDNKWGLDAYKNKKLMEATVAAEARKRRKELTRLKNLNGRQVRLQC